MAEIKIEKKKPIWPWILLIIVILAIIAYFVYTNSESDDYADDVNTDENTQIDGDADEDINDSISYGDAVDYSETSSKLITATIENQKIILQSFFRKSNEVLNKMNS